MDKERRSPLQSAAWQGHVQVLELLLLHRANINHMCNQGASALCIAAQEGHVEVVRALLHHGAEPNHADRQGRTAMKVAVKGGHHQVVELLEKCGAFPPVSPSRSSTNNPEEVLARSRTSI
ncbi:Ankyrin repeat domain-containing protein 50 [Apostichopus japonicus]|uniref:Ankyrin repeat domain-containing protein 50 n=1 Tax=Stichopus japonicus TaxID=307972 RepID=A0A2G8JUE7_STIJA|nr:Ankyrin repeat domain-containing protein 50 [Apostichopus japonicus]